MGEFHSTGERGGGVDQESLQRGELVRGFWQGGVSAGGVLSGEFA